MKHPAYEGNDVTITLSQVELKTIITMLHFGEASNKPIRDGADIGAASWGVSGSSAARARLMLKLIPLRKYVVAEALNTELVEQWKQYLARAVADQLNGASEDGEKKS